MIPLYKRCFRPQNYCLLDQNLVTMTETQQDYSQGLKTPFHAAAASAVRKALQEIEQNWQGSLDGNDVEAVHDLRVGTRRLRAALSVYEAAFPPKEFQRIERTMASLTDSLGPARDTDVLIEHLKEAQGKIEPMRESERIGLQALIDTLDGQRLEQQKKLVKSMRKLNLEQLAADLASVEAGHSD